MNDDVKTLYFDNGFIPYKGQEYNGHTITDLWSGDAVSNSGWNYPGWMTNYKSNVTKVVFTQAFADVRPTSLYAWFHNMRYLTDIEGIENLNTSQTTIMSGTFSWCFGLTAIDVSRFDVSKVTDTEEMFYASKNLKTIYCNNTWNIDGKSNDMFGSCYSLVGAVAYNDDYENDATQANPTTGYFTRKLSEKPGDANGDDNVDVNDVTTVINYILSKNPDPFIFDNANVNGDTNVDVNDVTMIINMILGIIQ